MIAKKGPEFEAGSGRVFERTFFSKSFNISLKLLGNDILEGVIMRDQGVRKTSRPFYGLYLQTGSRIKLSFITEWWNDGTKSKNLTAFTGTICHGGEVSEYLMLRWFEIRDKADQLAEFDETGTEVLFSYAHQDYFDE